MDQATPEAVVERDALLFRAGEYPDKDIEITEDDLDRMVENYSPAPIKVEHTDTPLRFGVVTRIWRVGRELFGRLAFNPLAWALARECGATRLSVAVRRDKSGIEEVSLVRSPRIADAAVFSREAEFFAGDDLAEAAAPAEGAEARVEGGDLMNEEMEHDGDEAVSAMNCRNTGGTAADEPVEFAERIATLERQLRARDVDAKIDGFKRQGKLAPAGEDAARTLLMVEDDQIVRFADPETGAESCVMVAKTFEAFLEAQPRVIEFSELAPAPTDQQSVFSSEEERLFEKLGVSPEAVGRVLSRER